MKIRVVHRKGQQEILTIVGPVQVVETNREDGMSHLHSADGTDFFFNDDDGTYDGWGRSVPGITSEGMDRIV